MPTLAVSGLPSSKQRCCEQRTESEASCQKRGTKPDQRARTSLAPVRHELLHQAGDGGIGAVLGEVPHRKLERERHPRRGARPISSRREESNSSAFQRVRGPRGPFAPRPPSLTHPRAHPIAAGSPQGLHSQEGGRDAQDGQVQQAHGDGAPAGTRAFSRPANDIFFHLRHSPRPDLPFPRP